MTAHIENIRKNIMGTTSFDMRIQGMRKSQDFIVYPMQSGEKNNTIRIQSDHRFGYLNLETGKGELSANYPQYANSARFAMDKATGKSVSFELRNVDNEALRLFIFTTAGNLVGSSVVKSDNSNAINVLNA